MTQVEKIIRKHYLKYPTKNRNWSKCGEEIYALIREKKDQVRRGELSYVDECRKVTAIQNKIEGEYNRYFELKNCFGVVVGYDWINGNEKLRSLLVG
jgi:hypothetical protein